MSNILVLNGPNLNLLGAREPGHYGTLNLATLNKQLIEHGETLGHQVICFQSNSQGQLIERVHHAIGENINFIIINPAAYTHTSIALRDAMIASDIPFIEVHLSNIYKRESFRQVSYFSDIAQGVITGLGGQSYLLALNAAHHYLSAKE